MLMAPFDELILRILCVAAIISLICGGIQDGTKGLIEGLSIVIAILIILVVTATNDYKTEKQFQSLQHKQEQTENTIKRNNKTFTINSEELVVGDLLLVKVGQ